MMEISHCKSCRSVELDSSWTLNQAVEFGVTCVKTLAHVKRDLEIRKSEQKALVCDMETQTGSNPSSNHNGPLFNVDDIVKDSVIRCHHRDRKTTANQIKQISLWEVLNKVKIQRVVLGVILCTLTIAISVPAGFVVRTLLQEGDASTLEFPIHQNYCKIQENSMDIVNLFDLYHDSCSVYAGDICDPYLQTAGLTNNVTTLNSMITSEQDVAAFFDVLDNFPNIVSKECNEAAKPLICHYTYPLCADNGTYQFPFKEDCVRVRDVSCAAEWQIALTLMPDVLPRCDLLDAKTEEAEILNNSSRDEAPTCPKHFKLYCNETCLPLCESFSDHTESETTSRIYADISAAILGITGGILLITISVFRRDSMLKHPAIFVVYSSLCPMVLGVLLLITYIQRDLYCTSEILIEALSNPSTFCRLTGVLTHFVIMLNIIFWFLHVLHLYLNVLFPLKFSLLKDKRWEKRVHIIEVIVSISFASLGPAVVWLSNNDYNTFTRPPLLCLPTPNSMLLYTMCLPMLLQLIIGVNLIATIVWALVKRSVHFNEGSTKRQRRHNCTMVSITPEIKMLILLCYFVVYTAMLSALIFVSVEYLEPLTEGIFAYFLCQLNGENPNCDTLQAEFRQYLRPQLASASFLMTGLINWIYLIFPIHYKDVEYIVSIATMRIQRLYKASVNSSESVKSKNNSSV